MKKIIKSSFLLIILIITVSLSGCGSAVTMTSGYNTNAQFLSYDVSVVAENEKFQLIWNDSVGDISFKNKSNGAVWCTRSCKDNTEPIEGTLRQKAPIIISYIEEDTFLDKVLNAYNSSINEGTFSAEKINNGIQVTYYFSSVELAVPVNYVLTDDGFQMYIDPTKIQENGNRIYSISFMPFMCSVDNSSSSDENYLFSPSGSGALIYPKTTDDGAAVMLSDSVYGSDAMNGQEYKTKSTDIKMAVFGAKVNSNAMLGIINSGAENADIDMILGSSSEGWSAIYPTFNIRGNYSCINEILKAEQQDKVYSDGIISNKIGVLYIPLADDNADYMGMADTYRNYLTANGKLKKANNDNLLNVKLVGGIMSKKFTFGVPHYVLNVLTDFQDVAEITNELSDKYDTKINADLIGFSKTGITLGQIAGGYNYNSKFGSVKSINSLDSQKISLFFDFDVVRYSESGKGINESDAALNLSKQSVSLFEEDFVTQQDDLTTKAYYLVGRDNLLDIIDKSVSTLKKWEIEGIGLSTLSSISYSDYTGNRYTAEAYMSSQTEALLKRVKKAGLKIAASAANEYVTNLATHIYDAPTTSKAYQIFDCEIPFYQIVYKGYKSMSVSSLNLVDNPEKELLKAIESGIGLTYTITRDYDSSLINSRENLFFNSKYSDVKQQIEKNMQAYGDLFKLVENQGISGHSVITDNVRITEYANGVKVIVNYGDASYTYGDTEVSAKGFTVLEGGK